MLFVIQAQNQNGSGWRSTTPNQTDATGVAEVKDEAILRLDVALGRLGPAIPGLTAEDLKVSVATKYHVVPMPLSVGGCG